jgi:membrane protease YdiL (CAAX protease family)
MTREKPPMLPVEWALLLFAAVVAAPLTEELLFRGVLLGWLRRASAIGHVVVAATALMASILLSAPDASGDFKWEALLVVGLLVPPYLIPVLVACRHSGTLDLPSPTAGRANLDDDSVTILKTHVPDLGCVAPRRRFWEAYAPIYGSSLLFAAFHASVWVSVFPLFVLALGLGWLAYRTGSLVGPITVHALFNAVACLVLVLGQAENGRKGNEETTAWRPSDSGSMVTTVPGSWLPRLR